MKNRLNLLMTLSILSSSFVCSCNNNESSIKASFIWDGKNGNFYQNYSQFSGEDIDESAFLYSYVFCDNIAVMFGQDIVHRFNSFWKPYRIEQENLRYTFGNFDIATDYIEEDVIIRISYSFELYNTSTKHTMVRLDVSNMPYEAVRDDDVDDPTLLYIAPRGLTVQLTKDPLTEKEDGFPNGWLEDESQTFWSDQDFQVDFKVWSPTGIFDKEVSSSYNFKTALEDRLNIYGTPGDEKNSCAMYLMVCPYYYSDTEIVFDK